MPKLLFVLLAVGLTACVTAESSTDAPASPEYATVGTVHRYDPRMDDLVPPDAELEVLAEGFRWSEGPVWVPNDQHLLFSDIPNNTVYAWSEADGLEVFLRPAGYNLNDAAGDELGTNGLILDADGHLLMADHGNRMIARLNANYTRTPLATRYNGERFNSPNDLAMHSNGAIYFTDPPYGLRGLNDSPDKERDVNGVYRVSPDGEVTLLSTSFTFPNGIAFSPDEQTLYIAQSDPNRPIIMAFDVTPDGQLDGERVFYDFSTQDTEGLRGLPDGMVVDTDGNVWATGPGGVSVFAPDGTLLGRIDPGQATANTTLGGPNGTTLYLTSNMLLCRIDTNARGAGL
ncbi:MAG: SMP-30/gluconolactonase/LRE family protein [Rhodothermales bacterium]